MQYLYQIIYWANKSSNEAFVVNDSDTQNSCIFKSSPKHISKPMFY